MIFRPRIAGALILCLVAAGCDDDHGGAAEGVKVVTWNVNYGFEVEPLLEAGSPEEIPLLAAQAFQQLLSTDFPERAGAIADRIAAQRPHLVGLQEVALIRLQSPGDAVAGGTTAADAVFLDYLQILLDALAVRGAAYRVAGKVQNVDVELPMLASPDPLAFDDIRLTDFDVVLARADVEVSNVATAHFTAKLFVPSLGLEIPRGYVAVDAAWGVQRVRFVTTHLEDLPFEPIQTAQAEELADVLATETRPVILVGDFNSPAPAGATCDALASRGYQDAWLRNLRSDEGAGLTWGHDADLRNPADTFTMRIDLVWVRPGLGARLGQVTAEVWGDAPDEMTASGLWPSDHGGVSAWMELPAVTPRKPR